jgi:hypothetical protein
MSWTKDVFIKAVRQQLNPGDSHVYLEGTPDGDEPLLSSDQLTGSYLNAAATLENGHAAALVGFAPDQKQAADDFAKECEKTGKFAVVEGPVEFIAS